jgi:uncharacterized protein
VTAAWRSAARTPPLRSPEVSWKAAIGSRRDVTVHSYPALNHLFIAGTGASRPAEYQVPGHVAEEVIRDVATWIMTSR